MAGKLYPPTIAGTLPSFYEIDYGTTTLVVPFSMNKTVSVNQIRDFSLRIKTTNTDILYGVIETNLTSKEDPSGSWNKNEKANPSVSFEIPQVVLNRLTIGQFYKIQLAYIDQDGITGYYSTVGIMKFTSKPEVHISDFNTSITNLNKTEYIGVYNNINDPTEKAYEYKFDLYDKDDKIIETSGWILHNSYEDTSLTQSIDKYTIKFALKQDITYKVQYSVRTNNNLIVKSPKYLVMDSETVDPELNAKIVATLDYNNACIDIQLIGERSPEGKEYAATGAFLMSRASSFDNFATWLPISNFRLTGELPSAFLFRDYTIEQGATYIYSLQQYNDYGIYSNRLLTEYVVAQFEDAYLFDGERQLKIRFNPKVSSFKTVVMESKKTTLGGKFPFIFRNGSVEYKEFPINGLISYMMDNDEFFLSKKKDLFVDHKDDTTDITDENVMLERRFKLEVLDWLNDGKVKLFKSPQEGNYIVRLMNVGLTPIDSVSRMLHNFSCQASEIADFTPDNLALYGLINVDEITTYQMRWETIDLANYQLELKANKDSIYGKDLLRGYGAYYIKFTDLIQGTTFEFTDKKGKIHQIMVGTTGAYEINLDEPVTNLRILSGVTNKINELGEPLPISNNSLIQGSLTFSILSASQNKFDTINDLQTKDIPLHQVFGPNENILEYYQNVRRKVSRIYFSRFTKLEVREVYNSLFGQVNDDGVILTGDLEALVETTPTKYWIYDIQTVDEDGQIIHHYYRYYKGQIYEFPHFSTVFPNKPMGQTPVTVTVLNEYTLYYGINPDTNQRIYYRVHGDKLIEDKRDWNSVILKDKYNNETYRMKYTDLTPYVVYCKKYYPKDSSELVIEYYKFTGSKLIKLDNYSTQIMYGNVNLDVNDKETIYIEELENLPEKISIGSGVCAELGLQVKHLTYSIEQYCKAEKQNYEDAFLAYSQACLGLIDIDKETVRLQIEGGWDEDNNIIDPVEDTYFIWEDGNFYMVTDNQIMSEGGYYERESVTIYHPQSVDLIASQATLDDLYDDLIDYEQKFITAIETLLDAQERGAL